MLPQMSNTPRVYRRILVPAREKTGGLWSAGDRRILRGAWHSMPCRVCRHRAQGVSTSLGTTHAVAQDALAMTLGDLLLQELRVTVAVTLPQLDALTTTLTNALSALGDRMADSMDPIRASVDALATKLSTTIRTELAQHAEALRNAAQDPAEVLAVAAQIDQLGERLVAEVQSIVPDAPPPGA